MATHEPEQTPKAGARPRARGCAGLFFVIMLVLAALWGGGLGAFIWLLDDSRGAITTLETYRPRIGSKVYSSDGVLLGEFTTAEVRKLINLSEIPLNLQKAFVATDTVPHSLLVFAAWAFGMFALGYVFFALSQRRFADEV